MPAVTSGVARRRRAEVAHRHDRRLRRRGDRGRTLDGGAGVLYLYGNYGGDVFNFDLAADLAELDDITTTTVLVTDDVLSAPPERAAERRARRDRETL